MKETLTKYKTLIIGGASIIVAYILYKKLSKNPINKGKNAPQLDASVSNTTEEAKNKIINNMKASFVYMCSSDNSPNTSGISMYCTNINNSVIQEYNSRWKPAVDTMNLDDLNYFISNIIAKGFYFPNRVFYRGINNLSVTQYNKLQDFISKYNLVIE